MAKEHLGQALTRSFSIPGGQAHLFERGAIINVSTGELVISFNLPLIGIPHIAVGTPAAAIALPVHAITFEQGLWNLEAIGTLIRNFLAEHLFLFPTGEPPTPVPITFGPPEIVSSSPVPLYGLPCTASLRERQLYDVAIRGDNGQWTTVAPNAIYYRSSWHDFGIAHITDIHLARRIDYFKGTLEQLGRAAAAERLYNWNDRFRGFIRYANYLHSIGELDVILATGDIIDYIFENDDDENGGGNAVFARELLLGRWPNAGFEDVGPLRVPIFMVGGNHDYRKHPYRLVFNLDGGPFNLKQIQQYSQYNLPWGDGLALARRDNEDHVPRLSTATAAEAVEVDSTNRPFTTYLADRRDYMVQLGTHRIVMLDSTWDTGIVTDKIGGFVAWLELAEEDECTFVGGSPNSEGLSAGGLQLIAQALEETPPESLVIVGLHAPLFNPWAEVYPWFLRETQRPAYPDRVVKHIDVVSRPAPMVGDAERFIRRFNASWFAPGAHDPEPTYVRRGSPADLFDYGVSRGNTMEALRLITGIGARRTATVVLHGHIHRLNEFRLAPMGGDVAYYMDFYTQNPTRYYPTSFEDEMGDLTKQATYVEVVDRAPMDAEPLPMPFDARHGRIVQVPPYATPLATAPDVRGWWAEHSPLVLQSEAYGPLKDKEVSFSGFRLLSVKNDLIQKIHLILTQRLHENGYRLPFEEAIKPMAPPRYMHAQRSREYNRAEAVGVPYGYLPPSGGLQTIIYRDVRGNLLELWRDGNGATGTGNLTRACNGPSAAGDPFIYIEVSTGLQVALFRGIDGHIHSLYWSTGDVGYDHLTSSVRAPKAAGNPVGYFEAAANVNHVIYRKADGRLHEAMRGGVDKRPSVTVISQGRPAH